MKFKTFACVFIAVFIYLSYGCARIVHSSVSADKDGRAEGIRYYNSSPYLLIYSNGKGGIVTQILYIADPQKKMTAQPKSFLASAQTTLEFDKGVLKNSKSTIDASSLPVAIMKAVQTIGVAALIPAANDPLEGTRQIPAPYLYKIIVNGSTISFVGKQGNVNVNVNLLKQEASPAAVDKKEPSKP